MIMTRIADLFDFGPSNTKLTERKNYYINLATVSKLSSVQNILISKF